MHFSQMNDDGSSTKFTKIAIVAALHVMLAVGLMCKFKPATSGAVAEQAWAQIAYVWTLEQ